MKPVEVVEIYVPYYEEFGWIRTRGRWGSISTFIVNRIVLEGMARDVLAEPEVPAAIDPRYATRSREHETSWPPAEPAQAWVVRENVGSDRALWVSRR